MTLASLQRELAEAFEIAKQTNQAGVMSQITERKAKLAGLWTERSEITRKEPEQLRDEETHGDAAGGELNRKQGSSPSQYDLCASASGIPKHQFMCV